jgi:hypothetical protein
MKFSPLAVVGLMLLAGCESARGSTVIQPLAGPLASSARVTSVRFTGQQAQGVGDQFRARFARAVQNRLDDCARGEVPLSLEVTVDDFEGANPGLALLFPNQSRISGTARLRDASGAVVGQYRIERSLTVGGLAGALMASQALDNMSSAFGDEVCKKAFGRNPAAGRQRRRQR